MEEVWKDLALSNLPYVLSPPPLSLHNRPTAAAATFSDLILQDYHSGAFEEPPPAHWPQQLHVPAPITHHSGHYASLSLPQKHAAEQQPPSAIANSERRLKRMIKNRESAARSRARKQAYMNELELEIAHLAEENTALKREQQQLKTAMAGQLPSKGKLKRGSSASF